MAAQVRSGTIRLTGTVESNVGRRVAEEDAALVPGVRRVVNDLAVDPMPPRARADRVVAHQVDRVLESDPWLDRTDVRVAVEHGVVRLQGTVRSAAERARAESDARATSPRAIDASALRITDSADDGTLRAAPPATRPDTEIRQAIADACRADPRIRPFVPEIDVRNGVVVRTGSAPNARSERAVAAVADDVPGVVTVRNAMRATPTAPQTDDTIRGDILDAVRLDPALGRTKLWVEAVAGRVILRGSVPNDTARVEALALAASVPGVTDVEDALIVEPPRLNQQEPTAAAGAASGRAPRR
jgi:osmotically-inducible protein OsmY